MVGDRSFQSISEKRKRKIPDSKMRCQEILNLKKVCGTEIIRAADLDFKLYSEICMRTGMKTSALKSLIAGSDNFYQKLFKLNCCVVIGDSVVAGGMLKKLVKVNRFSLRTAQLFIENSENGIEAAEDSEEGFSVRIILGEGLVSAENGTNKLNYEINELFIFDFGLAFRKEKSADSFDFAG